MRKNIAQCITNLVQVYMRKHLIYYVTKDRFNDDTIYHTHPLSMTVSNNLKSILNNEINKSSDITEELVVLSVHTFLKDIGYDSSWDIKNDNEFKNDIKEILNTEDMIMNCNNCRELFGNCYLNIGGIKYE